MNSTPPRVIGKGVYLRAKGPFGLSKDLGPKTHPNILWREKTKEIRDYMKMKLLKHMSNIIL